MKFINPFIPFDIRNEAPAPLDVSSFGFQPTDTEALKFSFAQAEKRLDDLLKSYDACTGKTNTFIGLMVAMLSILSGYFFSNNDPQGVFSIKLAIVAFAALYVFGILLYLLKIVRPHYYMVMGTAPGYFLSGYFFGENRFENPHIQMLVAELVNYNKRIAVNSRLNNLRQDLLQKCISFSVLLPAICTLVYVILSLISLCLI